MAEYIEREALLAEYDRLHTGEPGRARKLIAEAPAADVVEVRRGKLVEADDGDGVVCSVCGEDFCTIIHETDRFKFCPNCGARMDGE